MPKDRRWPASLGAVLAGELGLSGDGDLADLVAPIGVVRGPLGLGPDELGLLYPLLMGYALARPEPEPVPLLRKKQGAYYTPAELADRLAEMAGCGSGPVLDPACGAGALLLPAASRFAGVSRSVVAREMLFGLDVDPLAVFLCRHCLRSWAGLGSDAPLGNIALGDALRRSFGARFRSIVANPPFGNVVEGRVPAGVKALREKRFPELGGTADLAYYFASLSARLLEDGGRASLIQPRAFLSARSTERLRAGAAGARLVSAEPTFAPDLFDGAAVYVCLATFESCSRSGGIISGKAASESCFEITASMTVSEAYRIRELVSSGGEGLRLVTTGLIDPGACLWGERKCRYLGRVLNRPVLPVGCLVRREQRARRPKILVAGLSSRLEAFLDVSGLYIGAVSTYTITHEQDDVGALGLALERLSSDRASAEFRRQLGASALGGGNITVTKPFLRELLADCALS